MRTTRRLALVAATTLSALAAAAPAAHAQAPPLAEPVALTGTANGKRAFTGTFAVQRFVTAGQRLYAQGTLRGRARGRTIRRTVRIPAALAPQAAAAQTPPLPPTPNACSVLNLVLGPLDLNLLGLRVRLNQVRLLIEAVPSGGGTGGQPGGLLGDLLCGITNLLNPSANTPLAQVTRLLNALLALQGAPGALGAGR